MQFHCARATRGVFTIALAAVLITAAQPARAAQRAASLAWTVGAGMVPLDDAFSVLAGRTLSVAAPGVTANDPRGADDRALMVTLVAPPSHGALSLGADGGFEYTPARGFTGTDTFRYAADGGVVSGEADVTLHVLAQVDVALTATFTPAIVDLGSAATATFRIVNTGPGDAPSVRLEVEMMARTSTLEVRPDARCTSVRGGRWACPMGSLAAGETVQAAFTIVPAAPGPVEAIATVFAENDVNPGNDRGGAVVEAGRLTSSPSRLAVRTVWTAPGRPATATVSELSLVNESLAPLTYDVQAMDATGAKPAWLMVKSGAGTVDPGGVRALKVLTSPDGLAPGLQRGRLHFVHDSPFTLKDAAVSFTVAFRDVREERADDPYIHALAGAGVTAGCRAGWFCPDAPLTRGGAAVWMLLTAEGAVYQPPPAENMFGDVSRERVDAPFVEELVRRGAAEGCAADPAVLFCPDDALARADAAVFLLRLLEGKEYVPPVPVRPRFGDLEGDPRQAWVEDAAARELFTPCAAGRALFCPQAGLSRGDAAVALVKAFKLPLF
jgi:hypothetical protein